MKQFKLRRMSLVLSMAITLSSLPSVAFSDEVGDIPVTPMNTERIVVGEALKGGPVSSAVDKAIFDAVTKSLPKESVEVLKQDVSEGRVDVYGRPISTVNPQHAQNTQQSLVQEAATVQQIQQQAQRVTSQILASKAPEISGTANPTADKLRKKYKANQKISLKPGHSELVPVATGLQNRIATPFREVEVKTSDMEVPIEVSGGFVYVTPLTQAPIGLMIGEKGMPETMVSITLMPLDVPPVMIDVAVQMSSKLKKEHKDYLADQDKLTLKQKYLKEIKENPKVENDPRTNNQYVERATEVLTSVANGGIPSGFDLLDEIAPESRFPCDIRRMPMYHEVGQRLVSSREIIDVVIVKNDINGFREIREEYCLADDVIAVGVFDKATLAPGEDTELYIMRDKLYTEKQNQIRVRPRLTSTN